MGTTQAGAFVPDPDDPVPSVDESTEPQTATDGDPGRGYFEGRRPAGDDDAATDPADETEPKRPFEPADPANELEPGDPAEPVGNDNIRDGTVGGVMGGPRQQQGQGQGG